MSRNIYELVKLLDLSTLEAQLALQCAPLIEGIKMSNLFIVPKHNKHDVMLLFAPSTISYYILHESAEKVTFLLYDYEQLQKHLVRHDVRNLLSCQGYLTVNLSNVLTRFANRYYGYMRFKEEFPHEMGLLLGYPVEDVAGFIQYKGKHFLYTGYWKVYSNVQESLAIFEQYNRAKEKLLELVAQGTSIYSILQYHKKAVI